MITLEEEQEVQKILAPFSDSPEVEKMRNYIQHGHVTTYDHCYAVACKCYELILRHHLRADPGVCVRAGFLHDFYLYDWHEKDASHALHGYHHADRALENAVRIFQVGKAEQMAIYSHMWPLNLTRVPTSAEAWVVTVADKIVSTYETVTRHRMKTALSDLPSKKQ